jgi:hypothetical protein
MWGAKLVRICQFLSDGLDEVAARALFWALDTLAEDFLLAGLALVPVFVLVEGVACVSTRVFLFLSTCPLSVNLWELSQPLVQWGHA